MTEQRDTNCIIDGCQQQAENYFCPEHWYALPLELRRRWWRETDYSKNPPSPELTAEINRTLYTMMLASIASDESLFNKLAPSGLSPSMIDRLLGPSLREAAAAWRNRQGSKPAPKRGGGR